VKRGNIESVGGNQPDFRCSRAGRRRKTLYFTWWNIENRVFILLYTPKSTKQPRCLRAPQPHRMCRSRSHSCIIVSTATCASQRLVSASFRGFCHRSARTVDDRPDDTCHSLTRRRKMRTCKIWNLTFGNSSKLLLTLGEIRARRQTPWKRR